MSFGRSRSVLVPPALALALVLGCSDDVVTPAAPDEAGATLLPVHSASDAYVHQYYVAPVDSGGSASNDGTFTRPWDLQTGLNGGNANQVSPGDTVFLKGGQYNGTYSINRAGSAGAYIVYAQYPGMRATINSNGVKKSQSGVHQALFVMPGAQYTEFRGFEISMASANLPADRVNPTMADTNAYIAHGIYNRAAHVRFRNLVIHDVGTAYFQDSSAVDVELRGNIIYNNGWDDCDSCNDRRSHGHAIYLHSNYPGPTKVIGNVIFNQYGYGVHIYADLGGADSLYNITVDSNVSFNNGRVSGFSSGTANLGSLNASYSGKNANLLHVRDNWLYFDQNATQRRNLVLDAGTQLTATGNHIRGGIPLTQGSWTSSTISGNDTNPSSTSLTYRVESGRGLCVLYGMGAAPSLDLSSVLSEGDSFDVFNALQPESPLLTAVYHAASNPVAVADTSHPQTPINGLHAPPATAGLFSVFIVQRRRVLATFTPWIGLAGDLHDTVHYAGVRSFLADPVEPGYSWSWYYTPDGGSESWVSGARKYNRTIFDGDPSFTLRAVATYTSTGETHQVTKHFVIGHPMFTLQGNYSTQFSPIAPTGTCIWNLVVTDGNGPYNVKWSVAADSAGTGQSFTHSAGTFRLDAEVTKPGTTFYEDVVNMIITQDGAQQCGGGGGGGPF